MAERKISEFQRNPKVIGNWRLTSLPLTVEIPETRLKNSLLSQYYSTGVQTASYKLGWIEKESVKVK